MKTVVFTDLGYPALEQPGPPPNHLVVPADTALRLDDGRVLALDGSYRWWLLGQPAFGGEDGRQPTIVPDEPGMIGKSWADLAALKSEEHPFGLLKEARPETAAEKKAREKAEAEAKAAEEAAATAQAEAAEKARIAGLVATSVRFAQACAMAGIISRDEAIAWAASGALPAILAAAIAAMPEEARFAAEIKAAGALHYERSSPMVISLGRAIGKTDADLDALFQLAVTL